MNQKVELGQIEIELNDSLLSKIIDTIIIDFPMNSYKRIYPN